VAADSLGFDVERQRLARELFGTRFRLGIAQSVGFAFAALLFLLLGASVSLRSAVSDGTWWTVFAYFTIVYVAFWLAALPFSAYGHRLEQRYGLSRLGWRGWAFDDMKSLAFGYAFTLVAVEALYFLLREAPTVWWLIAWALGLCVFLAGSIVAPVLFLRLFYKSGRLDNPELESRLRTLAQRAGVRILGVHVLRSSVKSARSNAALAGAGRTRRIVLTDTLLKTHTLDEVETILAHELAHQKHRDPAIGFAMFAATTFLSLAILQAVLPWASGLLGLRGVADVAGLPILMVTSGAIAFVLGPLDRSLSRRREARADRTALEITGKPEAFATAMVKLHDENLSLARPSRFVEVFAMTHPAAWRRVSEARAFPGRALK